MTYLSTWLVKIDLTGETKSTEHEVVLRSAYDGLQQALRKIAEGNVMLARENHTHMDTVIEYQNIARAALGLVETDRCDRCNGPWHGGSPCTEFIASHPDECKPDCEWCAKETAHG